jgi:hypothetical protein
VSWLSVAGAFILLCSTPAYLHRSLRGPTRPHPLSWGIWAALGILGAAASAVAGAGASVIVLCTTAALDVLIFVVALRRRDRALARNELWPIVPAALGVGVWAASRDPLAATIGVVLADTCALCA